MVGEVPAECRVEIPGRRSVHLDRQGVEQHLGARKVGDDVGGPRKSNSQDLWMKIV